MRASASGRRFNLSRWFALASLLSIATLAGAAGWLVSGVVTDRMLRQEGALTQHFLNSVLLVDKPLLAYIEDSDSQPLAPLQGTFAHFTRLPDTLRTNVYDRQGRVVWSTEPTMIGRRFDRNDELDEALEGELVVHEGRTPVTRTLKSEHRNLEPHADSFVEIYMPVRDAARQQVIGVIEMYKLPRGLFAALHELRSGIFFGAAAAALLLYLALFGLVRRADQTMRQQERALVDSETMAAVGEMGLAVAHGIRNPLAAIRSSAELVQDADLPAARDAAADIIDTSDRLERWVRELLSYSRPGSEPPTAVQLSPVIGECLEEFGRELARHHIAATVAVPPDLPAVRGDAMLLGQVVRGLIANAVEAVNGDGRLAVRGQWVAERREVVLSVEDNGPGIDPHRLASIGKPFYTTKPRGLGIGLSLARRALERFGGRLEIHSAGSGQGTVVRLCMPTA